MVQLTEQYQYSSTANLPDSSVKVVVDEVLREQPRVVGAAEKHVVVVMNKIHVITQMFHVFFSVNVERYLRQDVTRSRFELNYTHSA